MTVSKVCCTQWSESLATSAQHNVRVCAAGQERSTRADEQEVKRLQTGKWCGINNQKPAVRRAELNSRGLNNCLS